MVSSTITTPIPDQRHHKKSSFLSGIAPWYVRAYLFTFLSLNICLKPDVFSPSTLSQVSHHEAQTLERLSSYNQLKVAKEKRHEIKLMVFFFPIKLT